MQCVAFSAVAFAEADEIMSYGNFLYDNSGNVIIRYAYSVTKEAYDDFLSYIDGEVSVTTITLTNDVYVIEAEAFSSSQSTLKEINLSLHISEIYGDIFGGKS